MSGAIRFDPLRPIVPGQQSPDATPLVPGADSGFKLPAAGVAAAPPPLMGTLVAPPPKVPAQTRPGGGIASYGAGLSAMTQQELAQCEEDRRGAMT